MFKGSCEISVLPEMGGVLLLVDMNGTCRFGFEAMAIFGMALGPSNHPFHIASSWDVTLTSLDNISTKVSHWVSSVTNASISSNLGP